MTLRFERAGTRHSSGPTNDAEPKHFPVGGGQPMLEPKKGGTKCRNRMTMPWTISLARNL
jgi:hypothetical protein